MKLYGGLGNQMFQYAFAKQLGVMLGQNIFFEIDLSHWDRAGGFFRGFALGNFGKIKIKLARKKQLFGVRLLAKLERKVKFFSRIFPKSAHFKECRVECINFNDVKDCKHLYLEGYWQNLSYLENIRDDLVEEFDCGFMNDIENKRIKDNILRSGNSVSLHVRRGDYIHNSSALKVHGVCEVDYYKKAIGIIEKKLDKPAFFIFSDDPDWARENIFPLVSNQRRGYLVSHNNEENGYKDMMLMKQCKHHVIANSTFSWWAAWLCDNSEKIVVAPDQWFVGEKNKKRPKIFPDEWLYIK
ncbi:alpha-1,2-fucosyltransferase [Piscirickettsia salmonis]|nr:alpha-1,2-fucosyltransferase [Piscirickettsia salmonis]